MDNRYINRRKIILASGSPRRKQLLEEASYDFEVKKTEIDENYPDETPLHEIAQFLAEKKSEASISFIQNDEILLTADSVVVMGNQIFGKPVDAKDAYRILAHLSGKMHTVYTGVCLRDKSKKLSFTAASEVYFRVFDHEEILWYINTFKPYDKAGSYAVQEWIGLSKIARIEGSYANIMGLPTDMVYEGLKSFEGVFEFSM